MARKTAEESEHTRLRLKEAGVRIFAEHGYAYSTLEDIAHYAGLSRGAVYWHFKGKGELLVQILNSSTLPFEHFFTPGSGLVHGFEQLDAALNETLCVQHHRDFCTLLLKEGEVASADCPVVSRWQLARQNLSNQLTRLLTGPGEASAVRIRAHVGELAHLMQLSITGLLMEALYGDHCESAQISALLHTLRGLVDAAGG